MHSAQHLTVTGPGGSGKTRLALALADRVAGEFPGGVRWVGLAGVEADESVGEEAVSELGVGQLPARVPADALAPVLGGEPSLLVLDSCEQVVDGCAELIAALVPACPELKILATSRQPLGAPDEQLFRVGGLPLDREHEGAIELFLARARRYLPALAGDEATMSSIVTICEQLDGMPLAIELAAARTPMMTVAEIAARLATDNRLLARRASGIPERHRSLEGALSWSYRLLTPGEQAVFRRLSVFPGTFGLEAAEAVAADAEVEPGDVLDALGSLVDQSLLEASTVGVETRYSLLLTVRQYAHERLLASDEVQSTRERHLEHFSSMVRDGQGELAGPEVAHWLDRLEINHDNLRAAIAFAQATSAEKAAELVAGLWEFWYRRGHYQEGRGRLEEVVVTSADVAPRTRAAVLSAAAAFAMLQCDYELSRTRSLESVALCRKLNDQRGVARSLQRLAGIAREQGDYDRCRELHEQSLAIWQELGDEAGIADTYEYLGFMLWLAGELDQAEWFSNQALELYGTRAEFLEVAAAKINLGAIAHYRGDNPRAAALLDEAIELSGQLGYQESLAWGLHSRALVAAASQQLRRAAELLWESVRLHWALGDQWRATRAVEDIAGILLIRVEPRLAGCLLASAERTREMLGIPVPRVERPAHDRYLASLQRSLARAELESSWRDGRELPMGDAVDEARRAIERLYLSDATDSVRVDELLTSREAEVLKLLSQGRTNREIGAALFISQSTAGVHVSRVLRKLGVRSRAAAVERAHELDLLRP